MRPVPGMGDFLPDRETFLRVAGSGLDQIGEWLRAEAFVERKIALRRAGHANRAPARLRHVLPSRADEPLARHGLRTPPAGIQTVQLSLPMHQNERVATQAVHHRLGDVHHRGDGDGRVHGIATVLENLQPDLGRQRLARCHHPMAGTGGGTARVEGFHC
jgi:hypothetical protein